MYHFLNEHLSLGVSEIEERDFEPLSIDEMTVFDEEHPVPEKTEDSEVAILRALYEVSSRPIRQLAPTDSKSLADFRHVIGGALEVMIGRQLPAGGEVEYVKLSDEEQGEHRVITSRLKLAAFGEELPATFLLPAAWNQQVVLWIDGRGKSHVVPDSGEPSSAVAALLAEGFAVGSIDLLFTGEFLPDGRPLEQARVVENPREFAGYTLGYNHPLPAQRTHDMLSLMSFARYHELSPSAIHVVATHGAAFPCIAAAALNPGLLTSLSVDTQGFRFESITDIRDVNLLPGAVKYGDLPAYLALCAPTTLNVAGESEQSAEVLAQAYRTEGGTLSFLSDGDADQTFARRIIDQA